MFQRSQGVKYKTVIKMSIHGLGMEHSGRACAQHAVTSTKKKLFIYSILKFIYSILRGAASG